MKALRAFAAALLSLTLCQAQGRDAGARKAPDAAYVARLAPLLTGLQKNPWAGWKAGTTVLVRYLGGGASAARAAYVQPDMVYQVLEADRLFIRTQAVNGRPARQDFLVKDQRGLGAARGGGGDAVAADVELDGFTLACLLSEWRVTEFPGGTRTNREWALAGHPSLLVRQETNGAGWRVASANVLKKIGEREFECVEVKERMPMYSDGPAEVLTTRYLSPDAPGRLVEQIEEFYRVGKGGRTLDMVVHQKVVGLKFQ